MKRLPESLRKALTAQRAASAARQRAEKAWLRAMRDELRMTVKLMEARQRFEDQQFGELEKYFKAILLLKTEELATIPSRKGSAALSVQRNAPARLAPEQENDG